jgi:predicted nucleic acid-binding protein
LKAKVYIETSIPSFYYEGRRDAQMVAQREWTREWWKNYSQNYKLFISEAVLTELKQGNYPNKEKVLALVKGISVLAINAEIIEIAELYIQKKVMPKKESGDAYHLAAATYHGCKYLLTWNCRNIANENKEEHICKVNESIGRITPRLITPLKLMGER